MPLAGTLFQRPFSHSQRMDIFSVLHEMTGNYGAGGFVNSAVSQSKLRYMMGHRGHRSMEGGT